MLTNNFEEREKIFIFVYLYVCIYACMFVCMGHVLCMMFGCKHRMGMAVNHVLLSCVVLEHRV